MVFAFAKDVVFGRRTATFANGHNQVGGIGMQIVFIIGIS